MSGFEYLVDNLAAIKPKRAMLNGREHLVVPMTMIVPGVLNGSKGPLHYPPEEVGKDPTPWNGMPITAGHPVIDGRNVSARDPDVLNGYQVGVVLRARTGDRLRADAWLDVARTNKLLPGVIGNLEAGRAVEISTGLFTDNEPAPEGATYNGKQYTWVARNYRPDHLAILVDQRGACSVRDGCGLLMNQDTEPVDNDWAKWNAEHKGKGANFHIQAAAAHLASFAKAEKAGDYHRADFHKAEAKKHGRAAETKSKRELRKATTESKKTKTKPSASSEFKKANARQDRKERAMDRSARMAPSKSSNKDKAAGKAIGLAQKHSLSKASDRQNAAALVKAHLDAAKLHAKHGDAKNAARATDKARKAAVGYSSKRVKQHEAVAKAFTQAGNRAMAAHYQARADFHKAHIAKLTKSRPTSNSEFFPSGEREFVFNQLNLEQSMTHQVRKLKSGKFRLLSASGENLGIFNSRKEALDSQTTQNAQYAEPVYSAAECKMKSQRAHDYSELANKTERESDHHRAANLHEDAVNAHMNSEKGADTDKAAEHSKLAQEHRTKAGSPNYNAEFEVNGGPGSGPHKGRGSNIRKGKVGYASRSPKEHGQIHGDLILKKSKTVNLSDVYKHVDKHGPAGMTPNQREALVKHTVEHIKSKGHQVGGTALNVTKSRGSQGIRSFIEGGGLHNQESISDGHVGLSITRDGGDSDMAKLTANERTAIIAALVANTGCGCWKPEDKEVLEGFSDNRLTELKANADEHLATNKENDVPKQLTREEFMAMAPPDIQEVISNAANIVRVEKTGLIEKLVANLKDDEKKTMTDLLNTKSLDEVRLFAKLAVNAAPPTPPRPLVYGPTGSAMVTDTVNNKDTDAEEMTPQRFDWNEIARLPSRNGQAARN